MEVIAGGQASRLFAGGDQVRPCHGRRKPQLRGSVRCYSGRAVLGWNRRGTSSCPRGSSSVSARVAYGCVSSGARISTFSDDGHLRYYAPKRAFARAEKTAECESERKKENKYRDKEGKRRMKLVRGLADDLRAFVAMDFVIGNGEDLAGDLRARTMAVSFLPFCVCMTICVSRLQYGFVLQFLSGCGVTDNSLNLVHFLGFFLLITNPVPSISFFPIFCRRYRNRNIVAAQFFFLLF